MTDEIKIRIEEVTRAAEEAFWKAVAAGFPTLTIGNLDPVIALGLSEKMRETVTAWVETNRPNSH